jgi:hypothetical protein
MTTMAQGRATIRILHAEEFKSLFVPLLVRPGGGSQRQLTASADSTEARAWEVRYVLGLGGGCEILVLPLSTRLHPFKVLANLERETECSCVLLLEIGEQCTKDTLLFAIRRAISVGTLVTVPLVRHVTLIHRRVNANEMK